MWTCSTTLADLGGMPSTHPPMGPNYFIFTYIFSEKCLCWRSTPPNGSTTLLWEILDPTLNKVHIFEPMKNHINEPNINLISLMFNYAKP